MFRNNENIPQNVLDFLMECTATTEVDFGNVDMVFIDECNKINERISTYINTVVPTTKVKKRRRGVVIQVFADEITPGRFVVGTRLYFWQVSGILKRRHWMTADDTENKLTTLKFFPKRTWASLYKFQPAKRAGRVRLKYNEMLDVKQFIYIF